MEPLKIYFEEIKKSGYFLDFRPKSIGLLSELLSKFVGGSQSMNIGRKGVNITIKKLLKWKVTFGEKIEVKGNVGNDLINFVGAVSVWKKMIDKMIYEDLKGYPIDGFHAWCTYMESKNFGFYFLSQLLSPKYKFEDGIFKRGNKNLKIVEGKENWDKRAYDYPGNFKLGGAFVSSFDKNKISNDKEFFKDILKAISFFFKHKEEFDRGKLEGNILEIGKFRANTLKLAKKGDIVAQRAYTTLLDGGPVKSSDFKYLNDMFKTNVRLKFPGEKYSYKNI